MPAHYVYDTPDLTSLSQGDVLKRTDALIAHLRKYHTYYADHNDYKYFMVLTQSCDLVRRDGTACGSPYITIAAVRPLETVLRREAAKQQQQWQRETNVLGAKAKDKMVMFLESLLDNNKDGYFYLHNDVSPDAQIQEDCCAFLQLTVALKSEHYNMCLAAKIAQLKEPFQAKLGHLIGQLYSRVGTTEWNNHNPENKVSKHAAAVLRKTFITFDDRQIDEGIADLREDGTLGTKTSQEIQDYINRKKVVPRKQKFQERAVDLLCGPDHSPIDQIRGRFAQPLKSDQELASSIDALLKGAGVPDESIADLRGHLIAAFMERLREHCSDEKLPSKRETIHKIFSKLLQDGEIVSIMK